MDSLSIQELQQMENNRFRKQCSQKGRLQGQPVPAFPLEFLEPPKNREIIFLLSFRVPTFAISFPQLDNQEKKQGLPVV